MKSSPIRLTKQKLSAKAAAACAQSAAQRRQAAAAGGGGASQLRPPLVRQPAGLTDTGPGHCNFRR